MAEPFQLTVRQNQASFQTLQPSSLPPERQPLPRSRFSFQTREVCPTSKFSREELVQEGHHDNAYDGDLVVHEADGTADIGAGWEKGKGGEGMFKRKVT
jgi:hypothetical protein